MILSPFVSVQTTEKCFKICNTPTASVMVYTLSDPIQKFNTIEEVEKWHLDQSFVMEVDNDDKILFHVQRASSHIAKSSRRGAANRILINDETFPKIFKGFALMQDGATIGQWTQTSSWNNMEIWTSPAQTPTKVHLAYRGAHDFDAAVAHYQDDKFFVYPKQTSLDGNEICSLQFKTI